MRARLNGLEYQFDDGHEIRVGRDPSSDMVSANPYVSRDHAVVRPAGDGWVLEDCGSRGGTFLGEQRISSLPINDATTVRLGDPHDGDELQLLPTTVVRPVVTAAAAAGGNVRMGRPTGVYRTDRPRIRIGRGPDNDVVVDDMLVSRYHAELLASAGGFEI